MKRTLLLGLLLAASSIGAWDHVVDQALDATSTKTDMLTIVTAMQAYAIDHNTYPTVKTIDEMVSLLEPVYIKTLPLKDAWKTSYRYAVSADGKRFTLVSAGSDRKFDETTWTDSRLLFESKEDCVINNDGFLRKWATE